VLININEWIEAMKVIFLDIDGVLITFNNTFNGSVDTSSEQDDRNIFDEAAVANLNRLLDETGARLVVTSSLRLRNSIQQIVLILEAGGVMNPPVIGVTPFVIDNKNNNGQRGKEILMWLSENSFVDDYIVIDDCDPDELSDIPSERIIHTNYHDGFGNDDVFRQAVHALMAEV
jgi:hypothetical protein